MQLLTPCKEVNIEQKQKTPRVETFLHRTKQKLKEPAMDYRYNLLVNLQEAFEFFNKELFHNRLPMVIITTQRHRNAFGFFCPSSYVERKFDADGDMLLPEYDVHEISIMPDNMSGRTDRGISRSCVNIAEKKGIRNAATAARYAYVLNCRPEEIMEFDIISTKGENQ